MNQKRTVVLDFTNTPTDFYTVLTVNDDGPFATLTAPELRFHQPHDADLFVPLTTDQKNRNLQDFSILLFGTKIDVLRRTSGDTADEVTISAEAVPNRMAEYLAYRINSGKPGTFITANEILDRINTQL